MGESINISSMKYNFKNPRYTFFEVRQIETQQKPRSKLTKKIFLRIFDLSTI